MPQFSKMPFHRHEAKMRILNVVSILSAREGGGNAERTVQLSRALAASGSECTVLTLNIGDPNSQAQHLGDAKLLLVPCVNSRFQLPRGSWCLVRDLVRQADVVHLMGYWSILGVMAAIAAKQAGIPYVVSPAGALPLFGRSYWIKRLFNWIVGKQLIRDAAGWIAITQAERVDFEPYGISPCDIEVLPNGVNEADFAPLVRDIPLADKNLSGITILFMGRLNLIKGPDLLLDAFATVAAEFPDARLVFAGPDEGLGGLLVDEAANRGILNRVDFLGFITGSKKAAAYRAADILVVPSRHEAMSIVAVEGGICGTAVLMTDQCGLDELSEIDPRLIVPANKEALAEALRMALSDLDRLSEWGKKWQGLVRERYSWTDLALRFRGYLQSIVNRQRAKSVGGGQCTYL